MKDWLTIGAGMMIAMQGISVRSAEPAPASPALRIVAFGDSTTAPRGSLVVYVDLLQRELPERGMPVEMINAGIGGHTTQNARNRFKTDVLDRRPGLVIIQFGINDSAVDVWRDPPATQSRVPLETYIETIGYFVDTLRQQGCKVILMTPNPLRWTSALKTMYGKPPYRPDDEGGFSVPLVPYVERLRALAAAREVPLLDVYAAFEAYGRHKNQCVEDLLLDGMHPNEKGHRLVADLLLDAIQRGIP